jgi:hypothetical protein
VLDLLRVRGLEPSIELEQTVLACQDIEQLRRWLTRALHIDRAEQLFD